MRESLEKRCNRFIENRDIIKKAFSFESAYILPVCAAIFMEKDTVADKEKMIKCHEMLKEKTGAFSNFRGYSRLPMLSMMASEDDPEKKLENAIDVHKKLREHFGPSQYLPLAAMVIADTAQIEKYGEICVRSRKVYDLLRSEHPFITSSEDVVFASILAMSSLSEKDIVGAAEKCYNELKQTFYSSNAVQSLSHVLALFSGTSREKASETVALYNELKNKGYKFGTQYELASLGVLAMQKRENPSVADELIEVDKFLAAQKGYRGIFGFARKTRLMHAAMILSADCAENYSVMRSAALGGAISMVIAQQVAMCAAIAAATAASSSSSN